MGVGRRGGWAAGTGIRVGKVYEMRGYVAMVYINSYIRVFKVGRADSVCRPVELSGGRRRNTMCRQVQLWGR